MNKTLDMTIQPSEVLARGELALADQLGSENSEVRERHVKSAPARIGRERATSAIFWAATVVLFGAVLSPTVFGQREFWDMQEDGGFFTSQVQIAGSRQAETQIEKARADLAAKEYERSVRSIQAVLDQHSTGALTLERQRTVGIRDWCHGFLASMPPEALERYRKIFDPYAQEIFERGKATADIDLLKDVFARYRMTSFGRPALSLATMILFERGRLADAAALAMLFLENFPTDESAPNLAVVALTAWIKDGRATRATEFLSTLDPRVAAANVEFRGQKSTVRDVAAALTSSTPTNPALPQTPIAGVFGKPYWEHAIEMPEREPRANGRWTDLLGEQTEDSFYWHPSLAATDDNTVYVSSGVAVTAFDLFSGVEKWKRPASGATNELQARRNFSVTFPIVVADGTVIASLESPREEERIIWSFTPHVVVPQRQLIAVDAETGQTLWTHYGYKGKNAAETGFLAGLNINSNPLVIGDDIIVGATRYHTSYHHYLCCFSKKSGALKWSTFVCTGQMEQNMFGNPVREAIPGHVLDADGIVYYSTNIGTIAAVDARQGTLRFTANYRQIDIPRQTRFDPTVQERAPAWLNSRPILAEKTLFVAPMDSNDLVAVDIETGSTKTVLTRTAETRPRYMIGLHGRHLLVGGRFIMAIDIDTLEKVYELNLGKMMSAREGIQGYPVISDRFLYATVRTGSIESMHVWDLARLKLILQEPMPSQRGAVTPYSGNLQARSDVVVVVSTATRYDRGSAIFVRAYYDRRSVRARLEAAAGAGQPSAAIRFADFLVQEKDYAGAQRLLEKTLAQAATSSDGGGEVMTAARQALYRLHLLLSNPTIETATAMDAFASLEKAYEYASQKSQELDLLFRLVKRAAMLKDWPRWQRYVDTITDHYAADPYDYDDLFVKDVPLLPTLKRYDRAGLVALLVKARHLEQRQLFAESVDVYQSVLRNYRNDPLGKKTAGEAAAAAIEDLITANSRSIYERHDTEAEAMFVEADRSGNLAQLQRLLELFPNSTRVADSYRSLARRFAADKRPADAAAALEECLSRSKAAPFEELGLLAEIYAAAGLTDSAFQVKKYLADAGSTGASHLSEAVASYVEAAKKAVADRPMLGFADGSKAEPFCLKPTEKWRLGKSGTPLEWIIVTPNGTTPKSAEDRVLVQYGTELQCLSLDDGKALWKFSVSQYPRSEQISWCDGRLVALLDNDLVAIDPVSGREIWRQKPSGGRARALAAAHGKVYVLEDAGISSFDLSVRSLIDGRLLYRRGFDGSPIDRLDVGDRWVLVCLQNEPRVHLIDGITGRPAVSTVDGLMVDSSLLPFLSADDHLIYTGRDSRSRRIEVRSINPETGLEKWSKDVSDDIFKDIVATKNGLMVVTGVRDPARPGKSKDTVLVLDVVKGTIVANRGYDGDTQVRRGTLFSGSEIFVPLRQTTRESGSSLVKIFIECSEMATQSERWRTAPFTTSQQVTTSLCAEGLLLTLTERKYSAGRTTTSTRLLIVDRATAKFVWEQPLDMETPSFDQPFRIIGRRLVVADGPILKVFAP